MKIHKSLIILSLLLIFYIILGTVSAADNADLSLNNINLDTVENTVDLDDEIDTIYAGETGNFSSLNKTITESSDSITYLDKNYTFDPNTDNGLKKGIIISKNNIMIDGQGYTIDGAETAKIFNISGENVTIKGINFINAHTDNGTCGGAISFNKCSVGSFMDCNFVNCVCEAEFKKCCGGVIYFNEESTGSFINCSFADCYCNSYWIEDCGGGAIYFGGSGSVVNSSFVNCTCDYIDEDLDGVGGAIYFGGSGSVVNSSFVDCNAIVHGGAISFEKCKGNYSKANVVNCSFVDCKAADDGGAIYFSNPSVGSGVDNCSFVNCCADSGGAIFIWAGNCLVSNCSFVECYSYYGSAISIIGSFIYVDNLNKVIPESGDFRAPIYNDGGTILSDVEITTMGSKVKNTNYGETVNITGTVTSNGILVAGSKNLIFKINSKELNAECDDYGLFTAKYTVDFVGERNVDASYKGSLGQETVNMGKLIADKTNVTVTVVDVKGKTGEKVKFTTKINDINGPIKNGTVIFVFNGKEYKANVINGIATIKVVLPKAGTYSATAYYKGDNNYNSNYTVFTVKVSDIPNPNPNKKGIPMEHTGNSLTILLISLATVSLGSLKRKL